MPRDTVALLDAPPDLTTPSLVGLSWLLRHKEAWPEGFQWDFGSCRSCAIGLAFTIFEGMIPPSQFEWNGVVEPWLVRTFPVLQDGEGRFNDAEFSRIFFDELPWDLDRMIWEITPEHVADAIDAYLAGAAPCS